MARTCWHDNLFPSSCTRAKVNPVMHLSTWRWARWSRSLLHTYAYEKHDTHDPVIDEKLWKCPRYLEESNQNLNIYVVSKKMSYIYQIVCIFAGREQSACTYITRAHVTFHRLLACRMHNFSLIFSNLCIDRLLQKRLSCNLFICLGKMRHLRVTFVRIVRYIYKY